MRAEVPADRLYELVFDCVDPAATARWWAGVLGTAVGPPGDDFECLAPVPDAPFEAFTFSAVPEPKRGKNRVHIDVLVDDIAALVDRGAVVLREQGGDIGWTVLADPEGNEFCAFVR